MAGRLSCLHFGPRGAGRRAARKGSFSVEFALISAPFFLLMMGIIELCLMEGAQQILENTAYNASRLAKTGYIASGQTQEQTINQVLTKELSSFGVLLDPTKVTMTKQTYSSFTGASAGGGATGYGTASEIVAYTISYPWKVFTPLMCSAMMSICGDGNIINLKSVVVVRNEPYS